MSKLTEYFSFEKLNTTWRIEFIAGLTTFLTMSYVVIVYPAMLNSVGVNGKAVFVATCLAAAFGSILMGLFARYPIALAPSMGLAAYFTYGVINKYGIPWPDAFGMVFMGGILFLLLTVTQLRQKIVNAIPHSIKTSIAAGIGLFLAAIALKNIGLLQLTSHLSLAQHITVTPQLWLCLFGLLLIAMLDYLGVLGAILIGILVVTCCGILLKITPFIGIYSLPPSISPTFGSLHFHLAFNSNLLIVIFTFFMVALFDNTGTLIAVLHQAKLIPTDGQIKRLPQVFLSDSIATLFGACLGTSTVGSYIESASGVRAGGRTGVTAIIVGLLFLITLFFQPLAATIPAYATAAALLYVACLMLHPIKYIEWPTLTESIPALITLFSIPITFSIAHGIGLGLVSYVVLNLITGKWAKLNITLYVLTAIFAVYLLLPS